MNYTTSMINRNFKIKVSGIMDGNKINTLVGVAGLVRMVGDMDLTNRLLDRAFNSMEDKCICKLRRGIKVSFYAFNSEGKTMIAYKVTEYDTMVDGKVSSYVVGYFFECEDAKTEIERCLIEDEKDGYKIEGWHAVKTGGMPERREYVISRIVIR